MRWEINSESRKVPNPCLKWSPINSLLDMQMYMSGFITTGVMSRVYLGESYLSYLMFQLEKRPEILYWDVHGS